MLNIDALFKGHHFDREIIVLCVRWYLRYKLSFRDLVEMMAERGLSLAHTTIMRWIQRYVPEFERRWNRFVRSVARSWRVDETYVGWLRSKGNSIEGGTSEIMLDIVAKRLLELPAD
jgi:transposase-like protein